MKIRLQLSLSMMCGCAVLVTATGAGERARIAGSSIDTIAKLVEQLGHADFASREDASRRLLEQGADAIPQLADAALSTSPETATRALHVLEEHLCSEERTRFEPADEALERLAEGEQGSVALGAAEILSRHRLLRERRAIEVIRNLGGTVRFDTIKPPDFWGVGVAGPLMIRPDGRMMSPGLRPAEIVIGSEWTGSTEGLKYLRRLKHRNNLVLYVVRASGVSLAEAQMLAATLPGLRVQERGPFLGISGYSSIDTGHCAVDKVQPDGPAERAGLKQQDVIRKVNDREIQGFDDLIEKLKDYSVDQKVTFTVERPSLADRTETIQLEVQLGKWELGNYTEDALNHLRIVAEQKAAKRGLDDDHATDHEPNELAPLFER